MAADDEEDDNLQWLDDAQLTDEEQNEEEAGYSFPELEMGFDLRLLERAGVAIEAVPQRHSAPAA